MLFRQESVNIYMPDEDREDEKEEYSDEQVKDILREALKMRVKNRAGKKISQDQLNIALTDVLGEFLTCYRIFGFDMDGKPIAITKSHNNMEKSAMENMFVQEFGRFMNSRAEL